jgi:hypothetical protein
MIATFKWSLASMVILFASVASAAEPLPTIKVSDNSHYFVKADGTPFFWLGDTAWSIFNHPAPADVDMYLDDRASKGFTVIQGCMVLWDGTRRANPDGQLPFAGADPSKINEAFFTNADSIIDKAESRGLRMAILPFWTKNSTATTRLANTLANPEKMAGYCKFLGKRYARHAIFWVLGGDQPGAGIDKLIDAEANGLIDGAKEAGVDKIMITYHPTGRQSSSFWFQAKPWLDFNSIQSGHFINTTNFQLVGNDYVKSPTKPTLDMEPGYENITDRLVRDINAARIQAVDVRRSAYLAVFAGSAGHTYGQGEVYEFWSPGGRGPAPAWSAQMPWKDALKLPASGQVQFVRYLIESRPMLLRTPDQSLIVGENSTRAVERFAAMRGEDGSYAFVYLPIGKKAVTVQTGKLSGQTIKAWWYDPRTGKAMHLDDFAKADTHEFKAPEGEDNDWVLVLDDAAKNYPAPGRAQ